MQDEQSPFDHMNCIDCIRWFEEGGLELFAVAKRPLLPTRAVMKCLREKIEFNLDQLERYGWRSLGKNPPPENTIIVIATLEPLCDEMRTYVDSLRSMVEARNTRLSVRVFEGGFPEWLVDPPPQFATSAPSDSSSTGRSIRDSLSRAEIKLAKRGLAVAYASSDSSISFVRPAGVGGTSFGRLYSKPYLIGIGQTIILTDGPCGTLCPKNDSSEWIVDISDGAIPGLGPEFHRCTYSTVDVACDAIIDCYFAIG